MEVTLESKFLSELTFFGLTPDTAPQIRLNIFTQIHEIVFYGKGGYDWETIYNMPIWLRNFTYKKLHEYYQKEAEEYEKASGKSSSNKSTLIDSSGNINKEAFKEASSKILPGPKNNSKPMISYT